MGDVVLEIALEKRRALRRIADFNEIIDHFTEFSRSALAAANQHERAKAAYIDSLPVEVLRAIGAL